MSDLPVNIDTTYADDGGDASVALHQQHHDAIHALYNEISGATPDPNSVGLASTDDIGDPLGLTGAVAATRYVGATVSGAPVTGTFAIGDFVIDQTGLVWVCTVAGTPGTWRGNANDLAHAEITANSSVVNTATATAITGLSINPTCPGSAIRLRASGDLLRTAGTADTLCLARIYETSTAGTLIAQQSIMMRNSTNETGRVSIDHKLTPSAGSHTYVFALVTSANLSVLCVGSATNPFSISAHET